MSPASALTSPSLFVTARSGAVLLAIGVVSLALLLDGSRSLPPVPSSVTEAVLTIADTPEPNGEATSTAKAKLCATPPATTSPTLNVHVEPAAVPEQLQPGSLAELLKLVSAGTVSLRVTPLAFCRPRFVTKRL